MTFFISGICLLERCILRGKKRERERVRERFSYCFQRKSSFCQMDRKIRVPAGGPGRREQLATCGFCTDLTVGATSLPTPLRSEAAALWLGPALSLQSSLHWRWANTDMSSSGRLMSTSASNPDSSKWKALLYWVSAKPAEPCTALLESDLCPWVTATALVASSSFHGERLRPPGTSPSIWCRCS